LRRAVLVTDGLYNTVFLVSSQGVIAVDPLPNLGERYLKAIAEVTDRPITHVIYSHEHTDHIGAAYLFPKNAVYIAQKKTAELLARRNDHRRPLPTFTFMRSLTWTGWALVRTSKQLLSL
jgi:glyoxylase-like metal-dependent hydrolase (beta-lactamase superfamily II)